MDRVHSGDQSALGEVVGLYWPELLTYANRLLGSPDEAEDVVQETLIRLWEHRSRWRPSQSLRSFLFKITRNLAFNESRQRGTRQNWVQKASNSGGRSNPTPIQKTEESELRAAVERGIELLPERRREVFVLARFHDMSYRQIGEVMGISPQTVANQMTSALADLRRSLGPFLSETNPSLQLIKPSSQVRQESPIHHVMKAQAK